MYDPFSDFITKKFNEKRQRNPSYSIRAFAKFLEVDQSSLSKAIKGQHRFSIRTLNSCIDRLDDDSDAVKKVRREIDQRFGDYRALDEDVIDMIAEWHHWAILELFKIKSFTQTPSDAAARLGISEAQAREALERLVRLGFIRGQDGDYELVIANSYWATTEKTTAARKQLQKSWLEKSAQALAEIPFEQREHGSMTFALDSRRLDEFKKQLQELQTNFGVFAQKAGDFDQVYQLTISLYPLSKKVTE